MGEARVKIGDGTNYVDISHGFETFVGTGTVFDDAVAPLALVKTAGSHIVFDTTEDALSFATNTTASSDWAVATIQVPHKWKVGSVIHPHLHWVQPNANIPNWLIQYRWQVNGAAQTTSWTTLKWLSHVFTYPGSGNFNQITEFDSSGVSPPGGAVLSDVIQLRLTRDVNNSQGQFSGNDTTGVTVFALSLDIHFEMDRNGTDTEYA